MRFRDAFLLGMLIGLVYAAVRYPATLGCIILAIILVVVLLAVLYWDWFVIGLGIASAAYVVARYRSRT